MRIVINIEVRGWTIIRGRSRSATRKLRTGLLAAGSALCAIVLLVSCSGVQVNGTSLPSSDHERNSPSAGTGNHQDALSGIAPASIRDLASALAELTHKVKLYKQAIESDDVDTAMQLAEDIASIWNAIDPKLDHQKAEMNQKLMDNVIALLEGTSAEQKDKESLIQLAYELYQALRDMSDVK